MLLSKRIAQLLISAALITFSPLTFAFDAKECGDLFPRSGDYHPPYWAPFYTSTLAPSVTSYISSWGKCSMYGANEIERLQFIAKSLPQVKAQAAQGGGEYVLALATLSGCTDGAGFSRSLREGHAQVFRDSEPTQVAANVDALIQADSHLRGDCFKAR